MNTINDLLRILLYSLWIIRWNIYRDRFVRGIIFCLINHIALICIVSSSFLFWIILDIVDLLASLHT